MCRFRAFAEEKTEAQKEMPEANAWTAIKNCLLREPPLKMQCVACFAVEVPQREMPPDGRQPVWKVKEELSFTGESHTSDQGKA